MRRRDFITLVGVSAAAWPLPVLAQQVPAKVPRVALVSGGVIAIESRTGDSGWPAFIEEMSRLGFVEGRTVVFGRYLVRATNASQESRSILASAPDLVFLDGAVTAAAAFKALTQTIPIVTTSGDPIGQGLVSNFAHPGGNVAVVANTASADSEGKNLALLAEVIPTARRVAYIGVGTAGQFNPAQQGYVRSATDAAFKLGLSMTAIAARDPADEQAFRDALALAAAAKAEMIQLGSHTQISTGSPILAKLALEARMPAISFDPAFTQAGGLLSYSSNSQDYMRKAAGYVALVLNGAKPGDLPVLQPTLFDLVINQNTAKAIGVTIPPSILAQANLVIE